MFFAQFLLQSKLSTSEGSSMTRVRPSNCHPTDKHPKALRTWLLCMPLAFCYLPPWQPGSKLNSAHYSYCKQVFSQASRISCCRVVGKYWWRTWLLCIDAEPDYSACHSPLATCHRGNQAGALNYSPHWLNRRPRRGLLTTRLSGQRPEIKNNSSKWHGHGNQRIIRNSQSPDFFLVKTLTFPQFEACFFCILLLILPDVNQIWFWKS